ncbi:MAG: hypothetical protein WA821_19710 [Anaerolineales bacterium]
MKKPILVWLLFLLAACSNQNTPLAPQTGVPTQTPTPNIATVPAVTGQPPHAHDLYLAIYNGRAEQFGYVPQACLANAQECRKIQYLPITFEQNAVSPQVWAPDGNSFATMQFITDSNSDIVISSADGKNMTNITNSPEHEDVLGWSPDGSQVIFERDIETGIPHVEVWISAKDGRNMRKLADGCCAQISPDGKLLYYLAPPQPGSSSADVVAKDVFVAEISAGGASNVKNLTNSPDDERQLSLSPDGKTIALEVLSSQDVSRLYLMNNDGTNKHIATTLEHPHAIAWSPDGHKIAFTSTPSHTTPPDIYVVDLRDGSFVNVSNSASAGVASQDPVWSPDGSQILFAWTSDATICIVNADGSNLRKLTKASDQVEYESVSWRP